MNTNGPNLIHQRDGMVLWITILFLQGAGFVGSMTGIPGAPENITVMFLNPTSVRVSWSTSQVEQIEKYDVTYKPTDARVVVVVAGNSEAVTLSGLRADTQYQLAVTAVRAGKKLRSRPIVFRTLEPPRSSPQHDALVTGSPPVPPPPPSIQQTQNYIQIRGVEVGIVVVVLMVWAGAIALFFNRWGKIRMLLPYQPDYKEQLKVPGTGVCATANSSCPQHTTQHACSQHVQWSNYHVDSMDSGGGGLGWPRASRPRINSATDVAGFLSQEFLRRHGSTSRLCRKVRSADNLPLETGNRHNHDNDHHHNHNEDSSDRHHHYSRDESIETDRETFLLTNQERTERYSDENVSKMQISLESTTKDAVETSLIEPCYQQLQQQQPQSLLRDSLAATSSVASSLVSRRFGGWRVGGSHEYVRCPVRQPVSIDERAYRRSCEPDFARITHHHHHHHHQSSVTAPNPPGTHLNHHAHRLENNERSSKSFDYAKKNVETPSVDNNQHFGLPILSISEPSPPDERERLDEYL